eukprot:scaffold2205_cov183-Ochromonas_danica.AAC.11
MTQQSDEIEKPACLYFHSFPFGHDSSEGNYPLKSESFVLDVVVANPAAPTHRRQNNSHKEADGASKASHEHKLLHYGAHTDILQAVPRQYYTFNVEATGRLGREAITFVEDICRVMGNDPLYWENNVFEPSPLQKLVREIAPAVAKYNTHALAYYKRNNFPLLA